MWLKLNLDGIDVKLRIRQYEKTPEIDGIFNWCNVDYSLTAQPWLNYVREHEEILLSSEIDRLADALERLLDGRIAGIANVRFAEPDFQFTLYPEGSSSYAEWRIDLLTENGFTGSRITLRLFYDDIKQLLAYLKLTSGSLSTSDDEIRNLIYSDVILWVD